jgi:hypothetical protein
MLVSGMFFLDEKALPIFRELHKSAAVLITFWNTADKLLYILAWNTNLQHAVPLMQTKTSDKGKMRSPDAQKKTCQQKCMENHDH